MPQTEAQKAAGKRWRAKNRERVRFLARERYRKNPEKYKGYTQKWRANNLDKARASYARWAKANRKKRNAVNHRSRQKRKDRVNAWARKNYQKNRVKIRERFKRYLPLWRSLQRQTNPVFMLIERMRSRIRAACNRVPVKKSKRTVELLGCTPEQLRDHIERLFKPGMRWENRHLWHVDHILPIASFDLLDPAQQAAAFHFTNLQPLWEDENRRKHTTIPN